MAQIAMFTAAPADNTDRRHQPFTQRYQPFAQVHRTHRLISPDLCPGCELLIRTDDLNNGGVNPYRLEKSRVVKGFERAAAEYEDAAVLPREVRQRLIERLDYLSVDPAVVVDMGAGTGATALLLSQRYPESGIVALDVTQGMLDRLDDQGPRIRPLCADAADTPFPDGSVDLIFSNLMLPWCDDLDAVLAECRRLIAPHGAFVFSTLGPDTLVELRRAWQRVDDYEHIHAFLDMHDIGDALMRAGFAEPVMDVERITMTYANLADLLLDLRRMGSLNALAGRRRGLVGRGIAARLEKEYEAFREQERLPATFEVVYGQAWGPPPGSGVAMNDGTVGFPIDRIGRRRK